jgi:hypothetical protein
MGGGGGNTLTQDQEKLLAEQNGETMMSGHYFNILKMSTSSCQAGTAKVRPGGASLPWRLCEKPTRIVFWNVLSFPGELCWVFPSLGALYSILGLCVQPHTGNAAVRSSRS